MACSHFKQMQNLYGINKRSPQQDFEKTADVKMTSLIMSDTEEYSQSIYELMLFLLSTEEDGDILGISDEGDISFVQKSEKGTDAFTVLNKGENILDKTLLQFEKIRKKRQLQEICHYIFRHKSHKNDTSQYCCVGYKKLVFCVYKCVQKSGYVIINPFSKTIFEEDLNN